MQRHQKKEQIPASLSGICSFYFLLCKVYLKFFRCLFGCNSLSAHVTTAGNSVKKFMKLSERAVWLKSEIFQIKEVCHTTKVRHTSLI